MKKRTTAAVRAVASPSSSAEFETSRKKQAHGNIPREYHQRSSKVAVEEIVILDESSSDDEVPPRKAAREHETPRSKPSESKKGKSRARDLEISVTPSSDELPTLEEFRDRKKPLGQDERSKNRKRRRQVADSERDSDSLLPSKRDSKSGGKGSSKGKSDRRKHKREKKDDTERRKSDDDSDAFVVEDHSGVLGAKPRHVGKRDEDSESKDREKERRRKSAKRRRRGSTDSPSGDDGDVGPASKTKNGKGKRKMAHWPGEIDIITDDEDDLDFSGKEDVVDSRRITGSDVTKQDRFAALRQSRQSTRRWSSARGID